MHKIWVIFAICILMPGCISTDSTVEEPEFTPFPTFNLVDEQNQSQNNSMYGDTPFVAYFSASWCSHCKPTLQALDDTIPEGHLLVFNKDHREQHSNMTEWKEEMESGLNRTLEHPFIHAPSLASSLNVTGIPTMFFVNNNGQIIHFEQGLKNETTIQHYWEQIKLDE